MKIKDLVLYLQSLPQNVEVVINLMDKDWQIGWTPLTQKDISEGRILHLGIDYLYFDTLGLDQDWLPKASED